MFSCEILADTLFGNGVRLTTFKVQFPRSILAEFNTHRMFSRNAASSRAIPLTTMLAKISDDPFVPKFRKNKKGMQGAEELSQEEQKLAEEVWLAARYDAHLRALHLGLPDGLNIHKQYVNRLLEPWMWAEVVVSATEWENMFAQRVHEAAEPSFNTIATMMKDAYERHDPITNNAHLPFMDDGEATTQQIGELLAGEEGYIKARDYLAGFNLNYPEDRLRKFLLADVAVGRLTKVSYGNLETGKIDVLNDLRIAVQMSQSNPGHWSPFEHVAWEARPEDMTYHLDQLEYVSPIGIKPKKGELGFCGNFRGLKQYRKYFPEENIQ